MTKIDKAFNQQHKLAKDYVEKQKHYLMHDYCMSSDQLSRVEAAYEAGFMKGVVFK